MRYVSPQLKMDFKKTFVSCEKDQEEIWKKLFFQNKPYSDYLKRLLIVNSPDCLDMDNKSYADLIDQYDFHRLIDEEYITVVPKFNLKEHDEIKSYILLEFDDFVPNGSNPQFRNTVITFTIVCHFDAWKLDNYSLRPHQIAGYIDGILDNSKLSGIGTLQFMGGSQFTLNEHLGGYMLRYMAIHGSDDKDKMLNVD